jgi:hypothetical protein
VMMMMIKLIKDPRKLEIIYNIQSSTFHVFNNEQDFLQESIRMEDRQILGSAELATNFSKLSCPAASQESPDLSWTCSINCNKLLHAQLLYRRSGV